MGCTASALCHFLHAPGHRSIDSRLEDSLTSKTHPCRWTGKNQLTDVDVCPLYNIPQRLLLTRCDVGQVVSIDMLPDDVLLEIFDFFAREFRSSGFIIEEMQDWQTLVHVCRRWRSIVFGSPRRLDLRLVCSDKTPARDTLDVWPALPLFIWCKKILETVDNIVAVLERSDHVCDILLEFKGLDLDKLSAAMQVPFPELTSLSLFSNGKTVSALPDSFLGGSAPRLQILDLFGIPFPGLPKLLLSATHLVGLHLFNTPHSGYIPPETIVTALSTLTRLRRFWLEFESPQSRPDPEHQHPPPPTRSVLPKLNYLLFKGDSEYLEVLVAHIDAPQLFELKTTLFNDIVFDTPQFAQFISRTSVMKALKKAHVTFEGGAAVVELSSSRKFEVLKVRILCSKLDWQVSSMEQVCASCLPPIPTLEDLHIYEDPLRRCNWQGPQGNIENALWLELLHPFASVKNLYLSSDIARCIVPAVQELIGARAIEVLPTIQNVFLEELQPSGPVQQGIQQVVAVRQAAGHPIAVSYGQNVRY